MDNLEMDKVIKAIYLIAIKKYQSQDWGMSFIDFLEKITQNLISITNILKTLQ